MKAVAEVVDQVRVERGVSLSAVDEDDRRRFWLALFVIEEA